MQVPAVNMAGRNFADLHDAKERHDVFAMMILGFQRPVVALFYVIGMFLLFLHLSHGLGAMFQSLGWKSPAYTPVIDRICESGFVADFYRLHFDTDFNPGFPLRQ